MCEGNRARDDIVEDENKRKRFTPFSSEKYTKLNNIKFGDNYIKNLIVQ